MKTNVILFVSDLRIGGTEKNVTAIAGSLDRSRFNVTVCCHNRTALPRFPACENMPPVLVIPWKHRAIFRNGKAITLVNPFRFIQWCIFIARHRRDVLHFFGFPLIYLGAIVGGIAGCRRIITTVQDRDVWKRPVHHMLDRCVYRIASRIICDSIGSRHFAVRAGRIPEDKLVTIYDGVDPRAVAVTRDSAVLKAELHLDGRAPIAGVIARLDVKKKGQDIFIDSIPDILRAYPEARFLIVGYGEDETLLRTMADDRGLTGKVIFAGARTDLGNVLSILDVVVIPSRWESIPKVLVEAMAMGKAVIAADAGDMAEVICDGENGILIPSGNSAILSEKVKLLFSSPEKRTALGEEARKTVKRSFSIEKGIRELETVYERCSGG
ncbi:MAG: glycosyltransferase [Candidatus Omnitrophica bacterium]|nr:glycosyltransferase [Candidatus Omnitrophota bacterium]